MAEQKIDDDEKEFNIKGFKISDEEITVFRDITFNMRHPDGKRTVPWPDDCEPQREVFGDNLAYQYIYEWTKGNLWNRVYEIEVNSFMALEYTIDFTGTENCDIQTAFSMENNILTVNLQPFEREAVVYISCNTKEDNNYTIKGSWKKTQIDPELFKQCVAISNNKIKEDYDKCLGAGLNEEVSWDKMPDIIRNNALLFVDGEFYPSNDALFYSGDNDENAINDKYNEMYVMWRRAGDFLNGGFPMIFSDSNNISSCIKPEYINQGHADNAWLISVISTCTLRPEIIYNLFKSKDGNNDPSTNNEDKMYGFFRMQLCDRGIWKECILDDLFPCQPYGLPIMANDPNNNQLWPALIEKLCAKIKGNCYQSLDGGSPDAAFADITGCPTETYDMKEYVTDLIFEKINKSYNGGGYNLLAVAICNEENDIENVEENIGLQSQNTYSILGINMDEQRIRLRDPTGKNQDNFTGEYNNIEENNNGIIWLSFSEFVQYFTSVIVCYSDTQYKEARQTTDILYVLILIPMSTQRNKFVKFGASDEDVKTNDLSSEISWENGDRLTEGRYPYASSMHWKSDEKGSDDDVRYIGLTQT
eukprot:429011_1